MLIFTTCFYYAGYRPTGYALIHVVILLALCISLAVYPDTRRRFPRPVLLSLMGFIGYAVINYLWKGSAAKGTDILIFWFDLVVAGWIVFRTPRKHLETLLSAWLAGTLIITLVHFYYVLNSSGTHATPPFMKHGYHFGFYSVLVTFTGLGMFLSSRKFYNRIIALGACLTSLIYLVVDIKASPVVGGGAGLLLAIFYLSKKQVRGQRLILIIIFILPVLLCLIYAQEFMFKDVQKHLLRGNVLEAHAEPMATALRTGLAFPVAGAGLGNFEFVSSMTEPPGLTYRIVRAHNSLFELFAETGMVGVGLAGLFLFFLVRDFLVLKRRHVLPGRVRRGIIVSLAASGVLTVLDFGLQMPANALAVVFLTAVLLSDTARSEQQPKKLAPWTRWLWILPVLMGVQAISWGLAAFWSERAATQNSRAQFMTAVKTLEQAHSFRKRDDRILSDLGLAYLNVARLTGKVAFYRSADRFLESSLEENPFQADIWYARAVAIDQSDDLNAGSKQMLFLEEAVRLDPNNRDYSMGLMACYAHLGETDRVFQELERSLLRIRENDIRELTVSFLSIWENPDETVPRMISMTRKWSSYVISSFAGELFRLGFSDSAVDLLTTSYNNGNNNFRPDDWLIVARLLKRAGSNTMAREVCDTGLQQELPDAARIQLLKLKIQILMKEGLYGEAMTLLKALKIVQPNDLGIRIDEITCIKQFMGSEAELNSLKDLVTEFPRSARAHLALARALEARGKTREALDEYRLADSLSGGNYQKQIDNITRKLGIDTFWQ